MYLGGQLIVYKIYLSDSEFVSNRTFHNRHPATSSPLFKPLGGIADKSVGKLNTHAFPYSTKAPTLGL